MILISCAKVSKRLPKILNRLIKDANQKIFLISADLRVHHSYV